jgi:hypothetical protein
MEAKLQEKYDGLSIPLVSITKRALDEGAEFWLNDMLEIHTAADLWVYIKQMEYTTELLKEKLKASAFESIGASLQGLERGEVLGHEVSITYPKTWIYSPEVKALQDQQKLELKALQAAEQANGKARQDRGEGRITVTIKEG